jgi:hypothetical protein
MSTRSTAGLIASVMVVTAVSTLAFHTTANAVVTRSSQKPGAKVASEVASKVASKNAKRVTAAETGTGVPTKP